MSRFPKKTEPPLPVNIFDRSLRSHQSSEMVGYHNGSVSRMMTSRMGSQIGEITMGYTLTISYAEVKHVKLLDTDTFLRVVTKDIRRNCCDFSSHKEEEGGKSVEESERVYESEMFVNNRMRGKWVISGLSVSTVCMEVVSSELPAGTKGVEMRVQAGRQINFLSNLTQQQDESWQKSKQLQKILVIKTMKEPKRDVCQLSCMLEDVGVQPNPKAERQPYSSLSFSHIDPKQQPLAISRQEIMFTGHSLENGMLSADKGEGNGFCEPSSSTSKKSRPSSSSLNLNNWLQDPIGVRKEKDESGSFIEEIQKIQSQIKSNQNGNGSPKQKINKSFKFQLEAQSPSQRGPSQRGPSQRGPSQRDKQKKEPEEDQNLTTQQQWYKSKFTNKNSIINYLNSKPSQSIRKRTLSLASTHRAEGRQDAKCEYYQEANSGSVRNIGQIGLHLSAHCFQPSSLDFSVAGHQDEENVCKVTVGSGLENISVNMGGEKPILTRVNLSNSGVECLRACIGQQQERSGSCELYDAQGNIHGQMNFKVKKMNIVNIHTSDIILSEEVEESFQAAGPWEDQCAGSSVQEEEGAQLSPQTQNSNKQNCHTEISKGEESGNGQVQGKGMPGGARPGRCEDEARPGRCEDEARPGRCEDEARPDMENVEDHNPPVFKTRRRAFSLPKKNCNAGKIMHLRKFTEDPIPSSQDQAQGAEDWDHHRFPSPPSSNLPYRRDTSPQPQNQQHFDIIKHLNRVGYSPSSTVQESMEDNQHPRDFFTKGIPHHADGYPRDSEAPFNAHSPTSRQYLGPSSKHILMPESITSPFAGPSSPMFQRPRTNIKINQLTAILHKPNLKPQYLVFSTVGQQPYITQPTKYSSWNGKGYIFYQIEQQARIEFSLFEAQGSGLHCIREVGRCWVDVCSLLHQHIAHKLRREGGKVIKSQGLNYIPHTEWVYTIKEKLIDIEVLTASENGRCGRKETSKSGLLASVGELMINYQIVSEKKKIQYAQIIERGALRQQWGLERRINIDIERDIGYQLRRFKILNVEDNQNDPSEESQLFSPIRMSSPQHRNRLRRFLQSKEDDVHCGSNRYHSLRSNKYKDHPQHPQKDGMVQQRQNTDHRSPTLSKKKKKLTSPRKNQQPIGQHYQASEESSCNSVAGKYNSNCLIMKNNIKKKNYRGGLNPSINRAVRLSGEQHLQGLSPKARQYYQPVPGSDYCYTLE